MKFRIEKDTLGIKKVPADAYYGIETARAMENFPVSGVKPNFRLIRATAAVKMASAQANMTIGKLKKRIGKEIVRAAKEIMEGKFIDQFVVDVFQAGAGTSHNMNANEVIANRALEFLGKEKGEYSTVHPHDHVNMSQSTNDVFPTAMYIAALSLTDELTNVLKSFRDSLKAKAKEFHGVLKPGRTHLQDAVPIRLGQVFNAYASAIEKNIDNIEKAMDYLREVSLGGTAVGTGINTGPGYRETAIKRLSSITGLDLKPAEDPVEITQNPTAVLILSGALRELAANLIKIANDLRLMSSGPRTGIGEITLPPVQPGSSIMPGKVNPVMAEMLNMVAFEVIGNDHTITMATQASQLELNVMMPVMAHKILQSVEILRNSIKVFTDRCILGIKANPERCRELNEMSLGLATILIPYIGYEAAADVAKDAFRKRKTVKEIILQKGILSKEKLDNILDPFEITGGENTGAKGSKK
jgi:aspartate ammonia-lyase